jgi:cupin fold WbuC family metalloprotein
MKDFKLDKTGLSKSYFSKKNSLKIIDISILKKISVELNKHDDSQIRICLHKNKKESIHQMIILQKKGIKAEIKKHKFKDKSYIILKGTQKINIFNSKLKIIRVIFLNKKNQIVWIPKNTIHQNISLTKTIHIETIKGPFDRKKDRVVYEN